MQQKIVRGAGDDRDGAIKLRIRGGLTRAAVLAACVGLMAAAPGYAQVTGASGSGVPQAVQNMQPSLAVQFAVQDQGAFGRGVPIRMFAYSQTTWNTLNSGGWLPADGRAVSTADYDLLFLEIGTSYGGDGVTFFNVPDLRERTPIGQGQGTGLSNFPIGIASGRNAVELLTSNLPAHTHTFGSVSTASAGSGSSFTNRQNSLALYIGVTRQGFFPSRSGGSGTPMSPTDPAIGQITFLSTLPTNNSNVLNANGSLQTIQTNQAFFSILGVTFGGNGFQTFGLPDARGRALTGYDLGSTALTRTSRVLGERFGTENVTLLTNNMPPHSHAVGTNQTTGTTGGVQPFSNTQPTLAVTYAICINGAFPNSSGMSDSEGYLGEIIAFGGNFAPDGYLPCDGRLLNVSSNPSLFALLGATFGGNGSTTFGIPDLRSRLPIGASTQMPVGTAVGADSVTITASQLPLHVHPLLQPTRCQVADIACDSGVPLSPTSGCTNTGVNEGDYNAFFAADGFFFQAGQGIFAIGSSYDISYDSGEPRPPFGPAIPTAVNNGVNEGDYNCFFNFFFLGC